MTKEQPFEVPKSTPELLYALQNEDGITPAERVRGLFAKIDRVSEMVVNDKNKFRVLGVDRYDNEDWVAGEFDSSEEAIKFAEKRSNTERPFASDESVATVYYAYSPEGDYLGNKWQDPKTETPD